MGRCSEHSKLRRTRSSFVTVDVGSALEHVIGDAREDVGIPGTHVVLDVVSDIGIDDLCPIKDSSLSARTLSGTLGRTCFGTIKCGHHSARVYVASDIGRDIVRVGRSVTWK